MREEWIERVRKLQNALSRQDIDGVLIMDRVSLYYYFGTIPSGTGFIPREGEPLLFVRRGLERARRESFFPITAIRSFRDMAPVFTEKKWLIQQRVGIESDRITLSLFTMLKKYFPTTDFIDISALLRNQRAIKSDYEIGILREAGIRAARSLQKIPEILLKTGNITELHVMSELEAVMRREGHQGLVRLHAFNGEVYYGTFASGDSANASIAFDGPVGTPGLGPAAPFLCSAKEIHHGEPIIVDVVFGFQGYIVDQTRIYVLGSLPSPLVEAHDLAVSIQNELVADLRPGIAARDLFEKARNMAAHHHLLDHFMGSPANRVSFVGHGIGLEIDEAPVLSSGSRDILKENMIIALEPKFFFAGIGGVGIENTFRVTEQGGERLTPLPDDIVEV